MVRAIGSDVRKGLCLLNIMGEKDDLQKHIHKVLGVR